MSYIKNRAALPSAGDRVAGESRTADLRRGAEAGGYEYFLYRLRTSFMLPIRFSGKCLPFHGGNNAPSVYSHC